MIPSSKLLRYFTLTQSNYTFTIFQISSPTTFKCLYCEKVFNKKSNCIRHTKFVHKRDPSGQELLDIPKQIFICDVCGKIYQDKRSLENHINVVHLLNKTNVHYKCSKCSFETSYKGNLKRHISKSHKHKEEQSIPSTSFKKYVCSKCPSQFKEQKHLKYHERKVHNFGELSLYTKRKCPMCPYLSCQRSKNDIHKHFEHKHEITVSKKHLCFNSFDEFVSWKKEIEQTTATCFIKRIVTPTSGYYQCHRSGFHKTKGHTKRQMKLTGSCKINGFCPASISMKLKENQCHVLYISTHVGHMNDLKHIRLTADERRSIALQLAKKKPRKEILKSIRCSLPDDDLRRIHLTNRKDIINIENSLNRLDNDDVVKHPADPMSISFWVNNHNNSEHIALVTYNPQDVESTEIPEYVTELEIKDDSSLVCDSNNYLNNGSSIGNGEKDKEMLEDSMKEISIPMDNELSLKDENLKLVQEFRTLISRIRNVEQVMFVRNKLKKIMTKIDALNVPTTSMS